MNKKLIYGIQQIGVGVDNADKAFEWYGTIFGSNVLIFEDNNVATHMAPYMGGMPHKKRALLSMNLQGGSGYEFWQYLDRTPQKPKEEIALGDFGIYSVKIKSNNIKASFSRLKSQHTAVLSDLETCPDGKLFFYVQDPWGNLLEIKESNSWFQKGKYDTGGVFGCSIGVSNINNSLKLYAEILQYDQVIYDKTGVFNDFRHLRNGNGMFRRVLLAHNPNSSGRFSQLFGESQIELIQAIDDYVPKKIFADRYWGDIGFIHLCFDIYNMPELVKECSDKEHPFKIRSEESFDMGEANGAWGYLEDPDGTLIEFVETRKVSLIKKFNWNVNLIKRDPHKPLPNWLIKAMSFKRKNFKK